LVAQNQALHATAPYNFVIATLKSGSTNSTLASLKDTEEQPDATCEWRGTHSLGGLTPKYGKACMYVP